jgi:hypothetical protein
VAQGRRGHPSSLAAYRGRRRTFGCRFAIVGGALPRLTSAQATAGVVTVVASEIGGWMLALANAPDSAICSAPRIPAVCHRTRGGSDGTATPTAGSVTLRRIVSVGRNSQPRSTPQDSRSPLAGGWLSEGCARRTRSTPLPALRGHQSGGPRYIRSGTPQLPRCASVSVDSAHPVRAARCGASRAPPCPGTGDPAHGDGPAEQLVTRRYALSWPSPRGKGAIWPGLRRRGPSGHTRLHVTGQAWLMV